MLAGWVLLCPLAKVFPCNEIILLKPEAADGILVANFYPLHLEIITSKSYMRDPGVVLIQLLPLLI